MATKKRRTIKTGGKKKRSKKSTAKKSRANKSRAKSSTKKSSKRRTATKKPAKRGAGKRAGAKKAGVKKVAGEATAVATTGPCSLTAPETTLLVSSCAPKALDIGSTLSQAGIDTVNQRTAFRDCVFQRVLAAGCVIDRGDIPHNRDTTLRDVVFAILGTI